MASSIEVYLPPGYRVRRLVARLRRLATAPLTGRARRELVFCLVSVPLAVGVPALVPTLASVVGLVALAVPRLDSSWILAVGVLPALALLVFLFATRAARRLGAVHRRLAARLLGERVEAPLPPRRGPGLHGWLDVALFDGPGWRAAAYLLLKLPVAVLASYAVFLWVTGLANLTYPFWWGMFRNHPPGVQLSPVLVSTPFPGRVVHVGTFPGTFAALALGVGMVLAAPWVSRAVTSADRWLIRGLLGPGPGRLAQRVRDLEATRALAVDDSAALLRRVERDLHDGAQLRLAALALNLGLAREKLGDAGDPLDLGAARELVDAAHGNAKEALTDLRNLARGIHPPALDNGLPDALATLTATAAVPVELTVDITIRPTPAIETITYFCAAELLTNATKHSHANRIRLQAANWGPHRMLLRVDDDGIGGARPTLGGGLAGLRQRIRTVDGNLHITSPPGGPTRIVVELPLRA